MWQISQKLRKMLKAKQGVTSIEVGLTIGVYFAVIFMIFELGRLAITNAYYDLAATEAVRITKNSPASSDYSKLLVDNLNKYYQGYTGGSNMGLFAAEMRGKSCIYYADNIQELQQKSAQMTLSNCQSETNSKGKPLAGYVLMAEYKFPISLPFIQQATNNLFVRHYFVVQEHERR